MTMREQETSCLLDALEKYPDLVSGKYGAGCTFADQAAIKQGWEKVTLHLNALGFGKYKRAAKDVRKKWLDLRLRVKRKATQINEDRKKTGGGEGKNEKLTPLEERVIFLTGRTSSEGITSFNYDTDRPMTAGIKSCSPILSQKPLLIQDVELIPSTSRTSSILFQDAELIPSVSQTSTDVEITPSTSHTSTVLQGFESCPSPTGSTQSMETVSSLQALEPGTQADENVSVPVRGLKNLNASILKTPRVLGFKRKMRNKPKTKLEELAEIEKRKLQILEEGLRIKRRRMENDLAQTELLKEQVRLLGQLLKESNCPNK